MKKKRVLYAAALLLTLSTIATGSISFVQADRLKIGDDAHLTLMGPYYEVSGEYKEPLGKMYANVDYLFVCFIICPWYPPLEYQVTFNWGDGSYDTPESIPGTNFGYMHNPPYGMLWLTHSWDTSGDYDVTISAVDSYGEYHVGENSIHVDIFSYDIPYPLDPMPDPTFWPVTVNVCDDLGNPLAGDIYIDNSYVGQTSVSGHLMDSTWYGQHIFSVGDIAGYDFQCFTINGCPYPCPYNPMYLELYGSLTITAHYAPSPPPPVQHSVTVLAYFEYYGGYDAGGYIELDGSGVGFAPTTFSVSEGTHQIEVNDIDYYYFYAACEWLTYNGNTVYDNKVTLTVDSDITITAHYVFYGYY